MIYTELTKKAMKISFNAHKDQVDKTSIPYVYHPFHLAEQMKDEYGCCVALLHDVVEDTDMTFEDLEKEGFPKEVIDALKLLTHDPVVPYMDYVRVIKNNSLARKVKLADLRHNSDLTRLDVIDDFAKIRQQKYLQAIELLEGNTFESSINFYPCLDIEKTTDFYINEIGLSLYQDQGTCRIFDTGYGYIGFCEYDDHILCNKTCISFNVASKEDVFKYYEKFKQKQIPGITEPKKHPKYEVYSFFMKDINGYTLEIQKLL